jgi:hypothetical protein
MAIKELGYDAKLCYCNLHEVKVDGEYVTEYFPLPEIEIDNMAICADLGISLDMTVWFEITITREAALSINYSELTKDTHLEVYGAENYLKDFYNDDMCSENVINAIEASNETQIHLCFYLSSCDKETIKSFVTYLQNKAIINPI